MYTDASDADKRYLELFARFAYIDDLHGARKWIANGKVHSTDRDADGFLLPAEMSPRAKVWRRNGNLHRAELDRVSKKALPAVILYKNGEVEEAQWFWENKQMTEEELTNKIEALTLQFQLSL
jgi:hypothetical protein